MLKMLFGSYKLLFGSNQTETVEKFAKLEHITKGGVKIECYDMRKGNYMKKKFTLTISLIILIMICVLSGCQKTPYTTTNKESDAEKNTQPDKENMSTDDMSMDKEPVPVTLTEEFVDEVLECGDVTVVLKGNIIKPDVYEGLCTYKAEIVNYNQYEQSMMFLFGENEELVYRNERNGHLMCNYGEQGNATLVNTSMYDENNYTGIWGSIFWWRSDKSDNYKTEVEMTDNEARVISDDIINKIGLTSFEYFSSYYYDEVVQMTPDGDMAEPQGDILTLTYAQYLQGIPVSSITFQRHIPHVEVEFDHSGVRLVSVSEYTYEVLGWEDRILSYEDVLEIFKKNCSSNSEYDGKKLESVKFEYAITKEYINGSYEIIAVPSWRFYFEKLPNATTSGIDVVINAIDGSIIKM